MAVDREGLGSTRTVIRVFFLTKRQMPLTRKENIRMLRGLLRRSSLGPGMFGTCHLCASGAPPTVSGAGVPGFDATPSCLNALFTPDIALSGVAYVDATSSLPRLSATRTGGWSFGTETQPTTRRLENCSTMPTTGRGIGAAGDADPEARRTRLAPRRRTAPATLRGVSFMRSSLGYENDREHGRA